MTPKYAKRPDLKTYYSPTNGVKIDENFSSLAFFSILMIALFAFVYLLSLI